MDLELTGRRAVVTGGSRGIGLAVARALAHEGADIGLVARDPDTLARAAQDIAARSGRHVIGVAADTGSDEEVTAMAARMRSELGEVDILVNAAATPRSQGADTALLDEINIKVNGYLRCVCALAPGMVERGWGRIINIGGIAARQTGSLLASIRTVSVAALTKNLADQLGPAGVNVTVLHPGWTRTEREIPQDIERARAETVSIGRLVTADEVAAVAAFLASPKSVAINGDAVVAGGGVRGAIFY